MAGASSTWASTLGAGLPPVNTLTAEQQAAAAALLAAAKRDNPADLYGASLGSGDAPPTGASDAYGPSVLAAFNESADSPEAKAYLAALEASQQKSIENQKAGVASAQGNLDNFSKLPVQYDLSPLMNLSDSWFGSNLQKGYKAPANAQELIGARSALEGALAKNRMGVTEAEKDRLQQNLANRQKMLQLRNEAAIADAKRLEAQTLKSNSDAFKGQKFSEERFDKFDAKYGEPIRGLTQMRGAVENLRDIVSANGGKVPAYGSADFNVFRAEIAKALTAYNRDYAKLGALSGPDKVILEDILAADASAFQTLFKEKLFNKDMSAVLANIAQDADTSVGTIKRQTERFRSYIPKEYDNTFNSYDAAKKPRGKAAAAPVSSSQALDSMKGL